MLNCADGNSPIVICFQKTYDYRGVYNLEKVFLLSDIHNFGIAIVGEFFFV